MGNGHGLSRDVGLFPGFLNFFFLCRKKKMTAHGKAGTRLSEWPI